MSEIQGFFDGLRPAPRINVTEWSNTYRILTTGAETGKYRSSRTPYLEKIMDCLSPLMPYEEVVVKKSSQIGFALALDTSIPTPSGWSTMTALKIGDKVFDEKGRICIVTFVSEVMYNHQCYEITFSDNTTVVADADHRWIAKRAERIYSRVYTAAQMFKDFKQGKRNLYAIDNALPLELPDATLPVPPYLLGVWLGDGDSTSNRITTHKDDAEEMRSYIIAGGTTAYITDKHCKGNCRQIVIDPLIKDGFCKRGHKLSVVGQWPRGTCKECHRQRSNSHNKPMQPILKDTSVFTKIVALGISPKKRIPDTYLRASETQRWDLLRGLMDTDGHINKKGGHCEFYTVCDDLSNDFCGLVASLGMKPVKKWKPCKLDNEIAGKKFKTCGYVWLVTFKAYLEKPCAKLKRKIASHRSMIGARLSETYRRRITDIRKVPSVPVKCIAVDSPSHLYLCSRAMIPTHNTQAGNNWLGSVIHINQGPFLMILPTEILAKRNSKQNIDPMIESTPELRSRVASSRDRDSGNTVLEKNFPGGFLAISWAGSANSARSTSFRFIYLDELSAYPTDAGGEGDPYDLFVGRSKQYGTKRKILAGSTPTTKGQCRITTLYEETDQQKFHIPCPHCGTKQFLIFDNLIWEEGKYNNVHYKCIKGCKIEERHKPVFLAEGEWIATIPAKSSLKKIGFHLSALYTPYGWYSWAQLAEDYDKAMNSADKVQKLKTFTNINLGETWEEGGDVPDWDKIMSNAENYEDGIVPMSCAILTAGVDIQQNRIEIEVVGWSANRENYSVAFDILEGSTDEDDVWDKLSEYLNKEFLRPDGSPMAIKFSCVDSGYRSQRVYQFCERFGSTRCSPVKGSDTQITYLSIPRPVNITKDGVKLGNTMIRILGVSLIKEQIYSQLKLTVNKENGLIPAGYCHFPLTRNVFYYKGLCSEVSKIIHGKKVWVKVHERNEPLDLRVYATAAAYIEGIPRQKDEWFADQINKMVIERKEFTMPVRAKRKAGGWL